MKAKNWNKQGVPGQNFQEKHFRHAGFQECQMADLSLLAVYLHGY